MVSALLKAWSWRSRKSVGTDDNIDRDCKLRVFLDDAACRLTITDRSGLEVEHVERVGTGDRSPAALLSLTMQMLAPAVLDRIGDVEIFLDDPDISIMDSRQAKLSHFEGRALAEFGKYQLGGRPVCFASHRFGETSAQETEKRVVAYISEDRLTEVLFALGKLARFATFFGPWSLQGPLESKEDEAFSKLAVHGEFSTLTMGNAAAGAIAVRNLPFGTRTLVSAYASEYGISEEDAASALQARSRLDLGQSPDQLNTGSRLALQPLVNRLSSEVAETADYFEYQRLSGRADALQLSVIGPSIAGLGNWLGRILSMDIQPAETGSIKQPALNLLEGMRAGILKLGNQHFDFVGGRFVVAATAGTQSLPDASGIMARLQNASKQPVTAATLQPFMKPLAGAVAAIALAIAGYNLMVAPANVQLANATSTYDSMLVQKGAQTVGQSPAAAPEPSLWAKDIIAVARALPYDITIHRMALIPGAGTSTLQIVGSASSENHDTLQLVSRFIKGLSASAALKKRFSEVTFAGINQSGTDLQSGTEFRVIAKVVEGAAP